MALGRGAHGLRQPFALLSNVGIDLRVVPQIRQLGKAGSHGHRVAAEGPGLVHRAAGGHLLHHLPAAAVGTHRHTAADDLAEGGEVGPHVVIGLGAAQAQAEPGNDLVEDQQGAVLVAQLPQPLEEALLRGHHSHIRCHRLHDDAGDLVRVLGKQGLYPAQVVVLGGEGVLHDVHRYAGAAGMAPRQGRGTGAHQQAVAVAVVAAVELEDLVPSRDAPGQTDSGHHRLRAGVHHADLLDIGHQIHHQLRDLHLPAGRGAEAEAVLHSLLHRLTDHRVVMPQNHGTPGAYIVDVFPAILIVFIGAVCPGDEPGRHIHRAEGAHRGVDPAGHDLLGLFKQQFGLVHQPISPFFIASASSLA